MIVSQQHADVSGCEDFPAASEQTVPEAGSV